MSANLINVTLNTGNNLAASQRPRRQDSYQQAMGSLDPSTYPGSKPRRQDSYQQAMSSFDSQVCSFDKGKSINDVRFWGRYSAFQKKLGFLAIYDVKWGGFTLQ